MPVLLLALATVLGDMLFQAGDGHGHFDRQLPLLGGRQVCELDPAAKPVARRKELAFEPSMFRATQSQDRERAHRAPVENQQRQDGTKANKKQILFFAFNSPNVRLNRCDLEPDRSGQLGLTLIESEKNVRFEQQCCRNVQDIEGTRSHGSSMQAREF